MACWLGLVVIVLDVGGFWMVDAGGVSVLDLMFVLFGVCD